MSRQPDGGYTCINLLLHCRPPTQGKYSVNEKFEPVHGPFNPPQPDQFVFIAHYITKSRADFEAKLARGGGVKHNARTPEFFDTMAQNTAGKLCNETLHYVHPLMRRST